MNNGDTDTEDEFESQLSDVGNRTRAKLSKEDRKKAEKLGVSPSELASSSSEDDLSERIEPKQDGESVAELGGVNVHEYPNPDKKRGALSNVYEKTNVFWSPEVKESVNDLWDDIEYEWKKSHDSEVEKHWDFYMACFRVILQHEDLVREELGMETDS